MWIDFYGFASDIGRHYYLARTLDTSTGRERWSLRERPCRTNRSGDATLGGWCGETNNLSLYALGVCKIVRLNEAGDRAMVAKVTGAHLGAFLERDGYPGLVARIPAFGRST